MCLIVVAISLTPFITAAEEDHKSNLNVEDELVPTEQIIEHKEAPVVKKKLVNKTAGKVRRFSDFYRIFLKVCRFYKKIFKTSSFYMKIFKNCLF